MAVLGLAACGDRTHAPPPPAPAAETGPAAASEGSEGAPGAPAVTDQLSDSRTLESGAPSDGDPPADTGTGSGTGSGTGPDATPSLERALDRLAPIASLTPTTPPALGPELEPIFTLIARDRLGMARVRLRPMIDAPDATGPALFLFGLTYHREKTYTQAMPWFERAIERDPGNPLPYHFAAWGQYYLGDLGLARRLFERHLALQPEIADSHYGLGLVELEEDARTAARERFQRALELNAGRPNAARDRAKARARLAEVHLLDGDLDDARQLAEAAVAEFTEHHEAWSLLARIAHRQGDRERGEIASTTARTIRARLRPGTRFPE